MHPREQILLKVYWKYHNFRPRKYIWKKCRLENGDSDMLRMTFDQFCCHRNQTPLPRPPYTSNSLFISYTRSSFITDSKLPMCNVLKYMFRQWWHEHNRYNLIQFVDTVYPKKYAHGFCFAVLCCGYTLTDFPISIYAYPSGLLHWHCGNLTIAPVPAKQPWWIWINTSCEFIMNDYITTTKQSTTKPCAYFLGYTVSKSWIVIQKLYGGIHSLIIPVVCCKHYKSPVVSPENVPAMRRLCVFFAVSPDKLFGIVMM